MAISPAVQPWCKLALDSAFSAPINDTTAITASLVNTIQVHGYKSVAVQAWAQGAHASCSEAVTINWQISMDGGATWSLFASNTTALTLSGIAEVVGLIVTLPIIPGASHLRAYSVTNAETTEGYTANVNARVALGEKYQN